MVSTDLEGHLIREHQATHQMVEALVGEMDEQDAHSVLTRTHENLHGHRLADHEHDDLGR